MHSGRKRTFAASPHMRKYKETRKSFLSRLIASKLLKTILNTYKKRKICFWNATRMLNDLFNYKYIQDLLYTKLDQQKLNLIELYYNFIIITIIIISKETKEIQ